MHEISSNQPLQHVDQWDDDVARRYSQSPENQSPEKTQSEFRNYDAPEQDRVREFYRLNHRHQTVDFVKQQRQKYLPLRKKRMGIWAAMEFLNTLVDESDPDTDLSQIEHLMQSAEAIRADGHPRWFIVTGLIHDLGKILCLFDEPQWAVVGDTFPVGCAFDDKIVLPDFFADNRDHSDPRYASQYGIYQPNIGLDQVMMSWGHDEYLYHVIKDYLPIESCYMIRYHSFYAAHRERAYDHLMNEQDHEMFAWVRKFNPYDLYSKSDERPDIAGLTPFYQDLIQEFFPAELDW